MQFRELPRACQLVIVGTIVLAIVAFNLSLPYWVYIPPGEFVLAAVICSLLNMIQIRLTADKSRMSLGFAGLLGLVVLYGPAIGAVIGFFEGIASNLVRHDPVTGKAHLTRPDLVKGTFNAFNHSLSTCVAGLLFVWCGGTPGSISLSNAALPAVVATVGFFLVNTGSMTAVISTWKHMDFYKVWHDNFLWTAPQFLASASSVIAVFAFYEEWKIGAFVFLPIIYVVYHSYRLYMDKIHKDLEHISALAELNNSVIASLATAIDAKDHYTNKHLSRVQTYALAMSEYMNLSPDDHEAVRCAALVHDIGKLGVPEHILTKPGKLTQEEHRRMQEHVEIGAAILRPVQFPWPVVEVVMGHHERWDGLGYPRQLKGEEIHVGARIIALADVFDALTSDRPYRKAMETDDALDYIRKHAGSHFDPAGVEALMAVLPESQARIAAMADGEPELTGEVKEPKKISNEVMQQIARANSEFFAMYDMSQSLRGPMSLDTVLQAVLEKIENLVPYTTCAVFLENGPDELRIQAVSGLYHDLLHGMRIAAGEGLSGRVYRQLQPIVNGPATLDVGRKIPPSETVELNSSLVVPLRANGHTLGTISLYHSSYNIYTEDHARLLGLIADHAANSVDGARRLHQTEEMALTDPLTGLPNARSLNTWLTGRLEASIQTHEAFALLLVDLDNFKLVNDTLGHLRGDEILREVAEAMQGCVRTHDKLARYAGDEFIIVIPHADGAQVRQMCDRIAESVATVKPGSGIVLGASVGFALYPDDGLNARDLIAVADNRMYQDKNQRKQH